MLPVKNAIIGAGYKQKGERWATGEHGGQDFICPVGTPVYAMRKGIILDRNWGKPFGIHIIQRRTYPFGTRRCLNYAHLSKSIVKPGQRVKKGQLIGYSGNTGNSTAAHLHVEERTGDRYLTSKHVDPWGSINA